MAGVSDEEIERLANRLGMLVSDDGEADNAGRAVGALARRLGLSGGQIKAIFMAGAESAVARSGRFAEQAARLRATEAELAGTRLALLDAESAGRALEREHDSLRRETEALHAMLEGRRTGSRQGGRHGWRIAAVVLAMAAAVAGGVVEIGPKLHFGSGSERVNGTPFYRTALVRDHPLVLHSTPDANSPALATLAVGSHLVVRRLLWHNLTQWVEVEYLGQTGYVSSTEVDLS